MAYIPLTNRTMESDISGVYRYRLPSDGVRLSDNDGMTADGKCPLICNMDVLSGVISSRKGQHELTQSIDNDGVVHSMTKKTFCGKIILHIGTCLYSYTLEDTSLYLITDSLPDEKSLLCEFMSKLYIYCATRIYSLDDGFVFTEEVPEAPLLYDGLSADNAIESKRLDTAINAASPRIKIRYTHGFEQQVNTTGTYFDLPCEIDTSRPFTVYVNSREINPKYLEITGTKQLRITREVTVEFDSVAEIVYYVKNHEDIGFENILSKYEIAESYGGTAAGTRIFFMGNPDKKGYYHKSQLQNPLFVASDEYEIIGDGCENVTAVIKMYGNLIIFTEKSVYRMIYSLADDGAVFSVKQVSSAMGCDCPDSVRLIDNRAVFANSEKGIFVVDISSDTDEHNIKPISGNINKGMGYGLLENSKEDIQNAFGVDYDRKYMLFVREKAYIWDYDTSSFTDSGNYAKAQERLTWYIYDGLYPGAFFETESGLMSFDREQKLFYAFSDDTREGFTWSILSGRIDFDDCKGQKYVTDMELVVKSSERAQLILTLYADGEPFFEREFEAAANERSRPKIRLPKKKLYDFGFCLSGNGSFSLEDVFIKYTKLK